MEQDLEKLDWAPFDYRNAAQVAFDGRSLWVRFAKGAVYRYDGVDQRTFNSLTASKGSGQVFVRLVRDRFAGIRVE